MFKTNINTVRDLKASFESRSKLTTANAYRSVAGDLANMSTQPPTSRVASLAKSIDSVLATPAASPPLRPQASRRPSWIGPPRQERPITPGVQAMKQTVTVEYSSPGLQPPVYILTSLSDPQWEPIEMHRETNDRGDYVFSETFHVEEGEYQYKFRLGEGDWWTCDMSEPTVNDGLGNKNNLLVVTSESPLTLEQTTSEQPNPDGEDDKAIAKEPSTVQKAPAIVPLPQLTLQPPLIMTPAADELSAPTPLLKHEIAKDRDSDRASFAESGASSEDDHESEQASPLLRHESMKPSSIEQDHAPLFRHESISFGYNHHESPSRNITPRRASIKSASSPPIPAEADPFDETLEEFPTDHDGIMWKIRHAHKRLPEDQTSDEHSLDLPISELVSNSSASAPSSPMIHRAVSEMLEKIRETEEEEVAREETTGEEPDPLHVVASMTPPEAEDADFEPKIAPSQKLARVGKESIIESKEHQRGTIEVFLKKIGGQGNAIAVAFGLLVLVVSIGTMWYL